MVRPKRDITIHGLGALTPTQAAWLRRRVRADLQCYFQLRLKFPGCMPDDATREFLRVCERIYAELIRLGWTVNAHAGVGGAEAVDDAPLWVGDGI